MEQLNCEETEIAITTYFSRTTYNLLMNEGNCQIIILFCQVLFRIVRRLEEDILHFANLWIRGIKKL